MSKLKTKSKITMTIWVHKNLCYVNICPKNHTASLIAVHWLNKKACVLFSQVRISMRSTGSSPAWLSGKSCRSFLGPQSAIGMFGNCLWDNWSPFLGPQTVIEMSGDFEYHLWDNWTPFLGQQTVIGKFGNLEYFLWDNWSPLSECLEI